MESSKYKMLKYESEVKLIKRTDVKAAKIRHLKNEDKRLITCKNITTTPANYSSSAQTNNMSFRNVDSVSSVPWPKQ